MFEFVLWRVDPLVELENKTIERIMQERQLDALGNATIGRAVTATLRVSANGTGANDLSWRTAYTTIQDALDAASTDEDDCTLILITPHTTNYDINRAGDPTWAANVILMGTHRNWAKIKNTHASATSIMKLTGKASVIDLNFNLGTGGNGLIMTHGGCRGYHLQFVGEDLTEAGVALWLDGSPSKHGKFIDLHFKGHVTHMTALKVDQFAYSYFQLLRIHGCAKGIQFVGASADQNHFNDIDIGDCAIGLDIDEGNVQHLDDILFHGNTLNIDDEVGDHHFSNIRGEFPITNVPDDLAGVTITAGAGANTWSAANTQVRAAAAKPFRVVGIVLDPAVAEKYRVRLFNGTTYFDDFFVEGGLGLAKRASTASSGTEFIFNVGTVIGASAKSESGGNDIQVSLKVQEI